MYLKKKGAWDIRSHVMQLDEINAIKNIKIK